MNSRERLDALMPDIRADLHRYAARLTGSPFDGEDMVQDAFARALAAIDTLDPDTPLRPWLFRIVHNRAMDHLRRAAHHRSEPMTAAGDLADDGAADPVEALARRQAAEAALSHFTALSPVQRSAVILKDVLDHSLEEIAALLETTVGAVKAALHRGRARLASVAASGPAPPARPASPDAARFAALFNAQDWDALRALLAADVHLTQVTHPDRFGAADVGMFFSIYAGVAGLRLAPAHMHGREVIAVFDSAAPKPAYVMTVEWSGGLIVRIRDFRYARYVLDGAAPVLAQ